MRTFIILILVSFVLCYCAQKPNHKNKVDIIPLSKGNYWIYSYSHKDKDGNQITKDTIKFICDSGITQDQQIWFNIKDGGDFALTNRIDGVWGVSTDHRKNESKAELLFKYPTRIGDSWETGLSIITDKKLITIDTNVAIAVPSGKFQCLQYTPLYMKENKTSGFFVSPGIGLIKCRLPYFLPNDTLRKDTTWFTLDLINYLVR